MKFPLFVNRKSLAKNRGYIPWRACQPFIENSRGVLIHRPRSVTIFKISASRPAHIGVTMWCGASHSGNANFTFLDAPPKDKIVCEWCELKAVRGGLLPSDEIVGRHVHKGGVVGVIKCCTRVTQLEEE